MALLAGAGGEVRLLAGGTDLLVQLRAKTAVTRRRVESEQAESLTDLAAQSVPSSLG